MTAVLVATFCVVVLATTAQAMTGFGFALVGVPLLTLALDPHTAVVTITTVMGVLTIMIVIREKAHIDWRAATVVTSTSMLGIPVGLYVLSTVSERPLTVGIAAVVLVFTLMLARGFHVAKGTTTEVTAGISSGILLAATGMNGPPLVAAFQAMQLSPLVFRATLQAVFAVQTVIVVAGLAITDQFDERSIVASAVAIPALLVGWVVGDRLFHRIAGSHFRRIVLATMALSAVLALVTAFA